MNRIILLEAKILALDEFFKAKYNRRNNLIEDKAYEIILNKTFKLIKQVQNSNMKWYKKIKYKRKLQHIGLTVEKAEKFTKLE